MDDPKRSDTVQASGDERKDKAMWDGGYQIEVIFYEALGLVAVEARVPEVSQNRREWVDVPLPVQRLFGASLSRRISQARDKLVIWVAVVAKTHGVQ